MRFRLRTLLILVAVGPPVLAFVWFHRQFIGITVGWMVIVAFFALWHWMLRKSQSHSRRYQSYEGDGFYRW